MKYTFILKNLNCAHCAGKIEQKIAETKGYENVSFNFATKQLNLSTNRSNVKSDIQSICDSIEDGVTVLENTKSEQTEEENSKISFILMIVAAVVGVSALALEFIVGDSAVWSYWTQMVLSLATILLAGYKTFIKGIKNIFKLRFDETALLTIAVIAAFCIGEFVEAAMVTILFAVGEFIEDKAVDASRRDIEKLAKIRPDTATLLIDGVETVVPAEQISVGSTIIVKPYERVPLDGVIISGTTTLDKSALTGESVPVDSTVGSEALSGSINGSSLIQIKTTKEFGDSTATRIIKLVEDAAAQKGKSEKLISRFAAIYTPIVIAIAVIIAVVPPVLGLGAFNEWLYRALVCLVASCPCAIVISVPLAYYSGIGAASEIGILIKGGKYLEALSKADTFVFDKTGTLTTGRLSVNKVTVFSNLDSEEVLALAASAEKYSSHPIAAAIREKAVGLKLPELSDYSESAGHGVSASYEGKKFECGSTKVLTAEQKSKYAGTDASVFVVLDGSVIGAISVTDTVRTEAKNVISQLHSLGVKNTVMLTGDSKSNAQRVCDEIGMSDYNAELMPADKLTQLNSYKEKSKATCFVGDGINDAPVLTASDCGIAMGLGSEAAIEASDAVLVSDTLEQLPSAIKLSRKVMNTVRTNIIFALTIKSLVIILAALGIAAMWMSVIADTGVSVACVLYASRLLKKKK
ncbi:MAG: cadmium-translocating P-type ATPase [Ruminococcus sp.]|nr:cadmium-translocating P-type ATPase [Ruminococcus sp.]